MKTILKNIVYIVVIFLNLPLWLIFQCSSIFLGRQQAFYSYSQFLSLFPGVSGNYIRYGFYKLTLTQLGKDVCICFGVTLSNSNTEIASGVYIGPHCNIGLCFIGQDTILGTDVHLVSGTNQHYFKDLNTPIKNQGGSLKKISIGEDCWIGNKSVVCANVGNKSVIGAGSVVVKPIPEKSVAVGNPARVVKIRG